jgi:hypothetical protein
MVNIDIVRARIPIDTLEAAGLAAPTVIELID